MNKNYPDQKVSSAHKRDNKEWARDMCEYVISLARSCNDKSKVKEFLAAANAEIPESKYKYLMARYETDQDVKSVIAQIRDVDFITPIKEKFMGEFINSYHNYQCFVHDPDVVFKRNQELGKHVYGLIMQEVVNLLNEAGMQTGQESNPIPDVDEFIDNKLKEWRNATAKEAQQVLDYLNDITDAKTKYIDAFYYFFVTNECYSYRRVKDGVVYKEILSPLEYYRVYGGSTFVEDDDYGMRVTKVSFHDILDEARDELSKANLDYLEELRNRMQYGSALEVEYVNLQNRVWMLREDQKDNRNLRVTFADKFGLVNRYHCVFKTPVKQGILTRATPDGGVEDTIVDETYKLDTDAGDISIKWERVNQFWEVTKYGDDACAIYTKPKPIEVQRELVNNNSIVKNPYNGISYLNRHSKPNPIPYRLIDYLALYRIYTVLQERWVNKFKAWIAIPESILAETAEMKTAERFATADMDGIFTYNDVLNETPNAINGLREIATPAIVNYLTVLSQLRDQIKQEAWELASWTPSRDGQQNPHQGKASTEYSINQSTNAAAWLYFMFNSFRERDYMADIDYSKFAWRDGTQGAYIDPTTNTLVELSIDGATHASTNYGVVVQNSSKLNEMFQSMRDVAFAAAQGGEFAMGADILTSSNIFEIKEIIDKHVEASRRFQEEMKRVEQEGLAMIQQMRDQTEDKKNTAMIEAEKIRAEGNVRVAEINWDREITKEQLRLERDANGNGFIDKEEAESFDGKQEAATILQERRLQFEREAQAFREFDANRKYELAKKDKAAKAKTK